MKMKNLPKQNSCKIAIVGLGYVGFPLALQIASIKKCFKTSKALDRKIIGFDINKITIMNDCTFCLDSMYHSYRRSGKNAGRMIGLIGIR